LAGNFLKTHGVIKERINKTTFKVELVNGNIILAYKASCFRVSRQKGRGLSNPVIIEGDKVQVQLPEKDLTKGMVIGFVDGY
jgi:translation initiation factor IF-1